MSSVRTREIFEEEAQVFSSKGTQKAPSSDSRVLFCFLSKTTEISKAVSFNLLNTHASPQDIKAVANLVTLKKAFPNGIIYRYRDCHKERSKRTGWSRSKFDRVIKDFEARRWVRTDKEAIYINGRKTIDRQTHDKPTTKSRFIKIDSSNDITAQLRLVLLQTKVNRIAFKTATKEAQDKRVQKKYYKLLREAYTPMSTTTLSKTFQCAKSTAYGICKKLKNKKLIRTKRKEKKFVGFCTFSQWENKHLWWNYEESINRCFFYKGKIYFQDITEYKVVDTEKKGMYPVSKFQFLEG